MLQAGRVDLKCILQGNVRHVLICESRRTCINLVGAALRDRKSPLPQGEGEGEGEMSTYQTGTASEPKLGRVGVEHATNASLVMRKSMCLSSTNGFPANVLTTSATTNPRSSGEIATPPDSTQLGQRFWRSELGYPHNQDGEDNGHGRRHVHGDRGERRPVG